MYHCHIIEHEDGGMMAQIETFDPTKPKQEYKLMDMDTLMTGLLYKSPSPRD
ncbi:Multicopper oxidase mco [Lactobacillus casei W56] [Lacticaseibacillus rhamnosus]|nr:Multicopper oxidase mco [Lactobacillus casei W56] [Lacticaseibacillus rhamnosus]